jgi:hypothetical protein
MAIFLPPPFFSKELKNYSWEAHRPRRRAAAFDTMRRWFFHRWGGEMDRDHIAGYSRELFPLRAFYPAAGSGE